MATCKLLDRTRPRDQEMGYIPAVPSAAPPVSSLAARRRWALLRAWVLLGVNTSLKTKTLRDRYSINWVGLEQLKPLRRIGVGAYAVVDQALYTQGTPRYPPYDVAVKRLKPELTQIHSVMDAFYQECALMRKLRHKNIVQYIGVGADDGTNPQTARQTLYLVQEFMGGGTLQQTVAEQMQDRWERHYSNAQALRWCIDVACALAYLHTANPVVIHRDLKMENILLSSDRKVAKLVDFGLCAFSRTQVRRASMHCSPSMVNLGNCPGSTRSSCQSNLDGMGNRNSRPSTTDPQQMLRRLQQARGSRGSLASLCEGSWGEGEGGGVMAVFEPAPLVVDPEELSKQAGTFMYMAPEMFKGLPYNEKVDVFSFGIIMYELFSRYLTICTVSMYGMDSELEEYAERVSRGYRPPLNSKPWPPAFKALIKACWAQNPAARPSMSQVVEQLEAVQAAGMPDYKPTHSCSCWGW